MTNRFTCSSCGRYVDYVGLDGKRRCRRCFDIIQSDELDIEIAQLRASLTRLQVVAEAAQEMCDVLRLLPGDGGHAVTMLAALAALTDEDKKIA